MIEGNDRDLVLLVVVAVGGWLVGWLVVVVDVVVGCCPSC